MSEDSREQDSALEKLADLEHRQWMHWSQYVAEEHDIPEQLEEKWETNWRPYSELSKDLKEKDRKWARKAAEIIIEKIDELIADIESEIDRLENGEHDLEAFQNPEIAILHHEMQQETLKSLKSNFQEKDAEGDAES